MIRLNAFFEIKDEADVEKAVGLGRELVRESLKDKGCISYDLFRSTTRPEVIMFCETWNSPEELKAHSEADHFKRIVPQISALSSAHKTEQFPF